jgi:hypothetical protein
VNGEVVAEVGETVPLPFSVIVTLVALPPKVFPVTENTATPHVVPVVPLSLRVGLLTHCPDSNDEIIRKAITNDDTLLIFCLNNRESNLLKICGIEIKHLVKTLMNCRSVIRKSTVYTFQAKQEHFCMIFIK